MCASRRQKLNSSFSALALKVESQRQKEIQDGVIERYWNHLLPQTHRIYTYLESNSSWGLIEQLYKWKDHVEICRKDRETISTETSPLTPQPATGTDITEGPEHRLTHPETRQKTKTKHTSLKGTWIMWKRNPFTNFTASAKLAENCRNSLWCKGHWQVPLFESPPELPLVHTHPSSSHPAKVASTWHTQGLPPARDCSCSSGPTKVASGLSPTHAHSNSCQPAKAALVQCNLRLHTTQTCSSSS